MNLCAESPRFLQRFRTCSTQVCGDLGRQSVEEELQVVVRVPVVTEDAGELAYQKMNELTTSGALVWAKSLEADPKVVGLDWNHSLKTRNLDGYQTGPKIFDSTAKREKQQNRCGQLTVQYVFNKTAQDSVKNVVSSI
ncbi:hypothetical protein TB1_023918 [Malus domestica]